MLSAFVRGVVTRSRLVLLRPANRFYSLSSVVRQSNPHSTAQIVGSVLRKPARRRRSLTSLYARQQEDAFLPKVIGQARADSYDLPGIMEDEHINSRYSITFVDDDVENSLHLTARQQYRINDSIKDAFIFSDGLIISWNMDQAEMEQIADFLQPFEIDSYSASLTNEETESMAFTYGTGSKIHIKNDVINLLALEGDNASNTDVLSRYAISHGIAASVKIAIWEQQLNDYAEPLQMTTKLLIKGLIPWKRKDSLRRTGEFAALRQSINLDSGLLNTDFYWERDDLEKLFYLAKRYFVVDKRLGDLNTRLDHCQNLVNIIDGMLAHRHASRLEWLIIILIVIEVIFDLLHYLDYAPMPIAVVDDPETSKK